MAIYYVDAATGSNSNPGSSGLPFLTVTHGCGVLVPGDTLRVRPGTYAESLFDVIPTGTAALPITVERDPATIGNVTIQPSSGLRVISIGTGISYVTVSGFILDAAGVTLECVKLVNDSHHITLQDCELKNAPSHGLLTSDTSGFHTFRRLVIHDNGVQPLQHQLYNQTNDNIIENCEIYGGFGLGIHQIASLCQRNIIRYNLVHDIVEERGIMLSSGQLNQVYYNVLYNCAFGIQLTSAETNSVVYNNTVYGGDGGIHMEGRAGSTIFGNTIRNNICYGQNNFGYRDNDSVGTTVDHNLFGVMQPVASGNILATDPLFVNAAAANFHLQAGSPAINAGVIVGLTRDFDGVTVSTTPDIGAFEFSSGVPEPPTNLRRV